MKPNFIVIGAPKAATTAICKHLGAHPDVFMSHPKEPFFFAYDEVYARGLDWYETLFSEAGEMAAVGEGSTVYVQLETFPRTLERMVQHVPDARLILAVRHPLDRIQSQWLEITSQGLTRLPFNQAVREDGQYIDASLYYRTLMAYREHFDKEKILVIFYDDFQSDPGVEMRRCYRHLSVDESFEVPNVARRVYSSSGKKADRPFVNLLRRYVPGFLSIRDRTPKPLRNLAKRVLKTELIGKPTWDQETKEYAIRHLQEDTRKFLALCGKPADHWDLNA